MPDRLLHQRPQSGLEPVVGPLRLGEPVDGATVADRCVPVLARLGHAAEAAVQETCDLDVVQHLIEACQGEQLVLVAGAGPAPVDPQQIAPDGGQRQPLGGVGVPLGVVQHLWLPQPLGRCTRVANPSSSTASPDAVISASQRPS
jgi:hypothetical protein